MFSMLLGLSGLIQKTENNMTKKNYGKRVAVITKKYGLSYVDLQKMLMSKPGDWRQQFIKAEGSQKWWDLYTLYLHSSAWNNKRSYVFRKKGRHCARCRRSKHSLQVHHLTYERVGNERLSDLQPLCYKCHQDAHKR